MDSERVVGEIEGDRESGRTGRERGRVRERFLGYLER